MYFAVTIPSGIQNDNQLHFHRLVLINDVSKEWQTVFSKSEKVKLQSLVELGSHIPLTVEEDSLSFADFDVSATGNLGETCQIKKIKWTGYVMNRYVRLTRLRPV